LADAPEGSTRETLDDTQRQLPRPSGVVDNVGYLSLMNELGYDGPVTLTPHPKCFTGMTRDAIVQQCANALEELWRAIGLSRLPNRPVAVTAAEAEGEAAPQPADSAETAKAENPAPSPSA
jgi:hypothetical protein